MADSKITALTAISTVDPAADPLVIVDVSDTSMAASGTTKKATINQLLGASGTATLASATISGNLTLSAGTALGVGYLNASKVLTAGSTLLFDGTNLGIAGTGQLRFATSGGAIGDNSIGTENSFSMMLRCGRGSTSNIELASDKLVFGVAATEQMRLNSTGLGIGVASPATKLDVAGNARVQLAFFTGGTIPGLTNDNPFAYRFPGGGLGLGAATETGTASPIIFYTGQGGVERVRVKGFGQVRFFPLAADPAGAEAGDVYYNSTSNKLKCYNGTTWNDLF